MAKLHIVNKYWITPNEVLNHPKLSFKAKWIFWYLQSKPDSWRFSVKWIASQCKDGREWIASWMNELEEYGYLERKPRKNDAWKRDGHDYYLYSEGVSENRITVIPQAGEPLTVNPYSISKKDLSKKELSNKEEDIDICASDDSQDIPKNSFNKSELFDKFWKLYPNKKWKARAIKLFNEAITNETKYSELDKWVRWYIAHFEDKTKLWEFIAPYRMWDVFLSKKTWIDYLDYKPQTKSLDFSIEQAVEKLDITILHKFLIERDWKWNSEEWIKLHTEIFNRIYERVEELWGNWADPESRKDLLRKRY